MPRLIPLAAALGLVVACLLAASLPPAGADQAHDARAREQIEEALELEAALCSPARIRPGAPVQLTANLVNRSAKLTVMVVRPGDGSSMGLVEPHLYYAVRYRPTRDDAWRAVEVRTPAGVCGMGDFRWHRNVIALAPGATVDLTEGLTAASVYTDFAQPGEYEVRLHYAFRRRGTTTKLPQADPVGDLGPMRDVPAYDVVSDPLLVTVVRPVEVVVESRDRPTKGVARRLSDLVHVRVENWTGTALTLSAKRLKVVVHLRPDRAAMGIRRKPISTAGGFTIRTLAPGESAVLVGPGGIYDEAWVAESDDPVEVQVTVAGAQPGTSRVHAAWVPLRRN